MGLDYLRKVREKTVETDAPKLEAILNQIDFSELRHIYAEKAARAGVGDRDLGFVERATIQKGRQRGRQLAGGFFNPNDGTVWLSDQLAHEDDVLRRFARFPQKNVPEQSVFGILCHEETHAVSFRHTMPEASGKRLTVGYMQQHSSGHAAFLLFNEGVTDLIAEEVYDEYLSRRRLVHKENGAEEEVKRGSYPKAYMEARNLVQLMNERISSECGIPKEIVWHGIIQGYFAGLDLKDEEVNELFSETFRPDFLQRLSRLDNSHFPYAPETVQLVQELLVDKWSAALKEKWRRFVAGNEKNI